MADWRDQLRAARDDALAKIRLVAADPARGDYDVNGKGVKRSRYLTSLWAIVKESTELLGDGQDFFEEHTATL